MKSFLLFFLFIVTLPSYSQSFLIMENGIILTTDLNGYIYDYGHYTYPQKLTIKGGQYFVEDENILVTIDENGYLYRKYEVIPQKILGKGINYFISDEGVLFSVDNKGILVKSVIEEFKGAVHFGGYYFLTISKQSEDYLDLYTVSRSGVVKKAQINQIKRKEIVSFGGNYFMTNKGDLYTLTKDGEVNLQQGMRVGLIIKRGGNYFVDSSNLLYVVDENGELKMPDLPWSLKISSILKLGTNYFIDQFGRLFVVDRDGVVSEKILIDYDFREAKIISL